MIDFAVRFQALVSNNVTVSRVHRPGAEGLAIRLLDGARCTLLDAFIAAHVQHLLRVAPWRGHRGCAVPAADPRWQAGLCRQVVFGADADVVWHDRARLRALPLGDDGLSRQHQQLAEQALAGSTARRR